MNKHIHFGYKGEHIMKMDELDKEVLLHIIELQTCVIEGKDIKTIFRKHIDEFRTQIGADIIAICAKENEQVDFKYILEEKRLFTHLLKKYFPASIIACKGIKPTNSDPETLIPRFKAFLNTSS